MPCQSYEDPRDTVNEREIRDRLARIACKALTALEELGDAGGLEFILLQDKEIADWWRQHKEEDRRAKAIEEAKRKRLEAERELQEKRARIKAKLTPEEIRILGVK
jgi:hypothetical protein